MKDGAVTGVLIVTVCLSLIFSALIWTGTPSQATIDRPGFFSSPTYGGLRNVEDLIRPQAVWLWTSSNELFRIGGDTKTTMAIIASLAKGKWAGHSLHRLSKSVSLVPVHAYLKIDYGITSKNPAPLSLFLPAIGSQVTSPVESSLYISATGKANEFLLAFRTGQSIWQGLLSLVPKSLGNAFMPNDQETPYAQIPLDGKIMDLPYDSVEMPVETWSLARPVSSRIIDSFFADPTIVQEITEPRHVTLYTDGTRGVRTAKGAFGDQIQYMNPSQPLPGQILNPSQAFQASVFFINDHGGFVGEQNGMYVGNSLHGTDSYFTFNEWVGGWPLFSSLDQIHVAAQNGIVVGLSRELAYLSYLIAERKEQILSGTQLINRVGASELHHLTRITLGYGVLSVTADMVELTPVYRMTFSNHSARYVYANNGLPFNGTGSQS